MWFVISNPSIENPNAATVIPIVDPMLYQNPVFQGIFSNYQLFVMQKASILEPTPIVESNDGGDSKIEIVLFLVILELQCMKVRFP